MAGWVETILGCGGMIQAGGVAARMKESGSLAVLIGPFYVFSPGADNQTALLYGDPSKPGLYVQITKRGPNVWSQPHSHPNERFITVLAGTFLIGTGQKFDKNNTVAIGPGGVVHDIQSVSLRRNRSRGRHARIHRHGSGNEEPEVNG